MTAKTQTQTASLSTVFAAAAQAILEGQRGGIRKQIAKASPDETVAKAATKAFLDTFGKDAKFGKAELRLDALTLAALSAE